MSIPAKVIEDAMQAYWGPSHKSSLTPEQRMCAALEAAHYSELVEALKRCLNFIENTESDLGIELESAIKARALLAKLGEK